MMRYEDAVSRSPFTKHSCKQNGHKHGRNITNVIELQNTSIEKQNKFSRCQIFIKSLLHMIFSQNTLIVPGWHAEDVKRRLSSYNTVYSHF